TGESLGEFETVEFPMLGESRAALGGPKPLERGGAPGKRRPVPTGLQKENAMKLRALASLFLATSIVAAAGSASAQAADTSKVIGLRFETTLFQPFDVRGISTFGLKEGEKPLPARADVFRPNGDIRIGYDLPFGLTPMVGFGLRSHSVKQYSDADDEELAEGVGRTDIVISAELRYYFSPHKRGLQPFVFGEANWNIASFGFSKDEEAEATEDFADALGDVNSFMNLNAGL